jgi:hypothetical protein
MEKAVTLVMLHLPTPARESSAWTHVPSQPPVRSPLSQFRTPTVISQRRRFFRVRPSCGSPRWTASPSLLCPATLSCQPFRPSTKAILIHRGELSTPKVGANAVYLRVGIHSPNSHKIRRLLLLSNARPQQIHMFFTETGAQIRDFSEEPNLPLDESRELPHLVHKDLDA